MKIEINDKEFEFSDGLNLSLILKKLDYNLDLIAVECNQDIIKKEIWDKFMPKNGDKFIVVEFVGGG